MPGQEFLSKTSDNLVTKEKYLLLKQNDPIAGRILDVKKGILFIRNGKFNLQTNTIQTHNEQSAAFDSIADLTVEHFGFWQKVWHFIIKNDKVELKDNAPIRVKLLKPLKIDLGNGWIIE